MLITRTSPFTGITRELDIPVTQEQLDAWQAGGLIQNIMPNLSAGQREFLMTGVIDEEWDEAFSEK